MTISEHTKNSFTYLRAIEHAIKKGLLPESELKPIRNQISRSLLQGKKRPTTIPKGEAQTKSNQIWWTVHGDRGSATGEAECHHCVRELMMQQEKPSSTFKKRKVKLSIHIRKRAYIETQTGNHIKITRRIEGENSYLPKW